MDAQLWYRDGKDKMVHIGQWSVRGRLTQTSLAELREEMSRIIAAGNEPEVSLARADTRCVGGACFAYVSRDTQANTRDSQWTPRGKDYATLCAAVRGAGA